MRSQMPVILVMALGVAAMMWGMAGVEDAYSSDNLDELDSDQELSDQANESAVGEDGEFTGATGQTDDGDIVGLIVSGAGSIARFLGAVVLLPLEIHSLGAPWWFALPIGLSAQTIVGIGLIEFVINREWT